MMGHDHTTYPPTVARRGIFTRLEAYYSMDSGIVAGGLVSAHHECCSTQYSHLREGQ